MNVNRDLGNETTSTGTVLPTTFYIYYITIIFPEWRRNKENIVSLRRFLTWIINKITTI